MVCPVLVLLCRRERSLDPVIRQQRLRPESRRAGQDRLQLQRRHLHRHRRPARVFRGGRPPRALLPGPASAGGAGDPPRSHRQDQGRRRRVRGVRPRPAGADARSPQPAAAGAAFRARPARVPALTRIWPAGKSTGANHLYAPCPGGAASQRRQLATRSMANERCANSSSRWTRRLSHFAQQHCSTNPHEPPRASPPGLVQWPAARGFVVGVVVGIPRWHARGQGFKSPQLHQAIHLLRPAPSVACQQFASNDAGWPPGRWQR
jgi:hypothetical protein